MQLQKRFNRKVGDKEYSKWQVVISPEKIDELGWKEGEELTDEVQGNKLILHPKQTANPSKSKNFEDDIGLVMKHNKNRKE